MEFQMNGLTSEIIVKAINELIRAADGLRLRISEEAGLVSQYVSDYGYEAIPTTDASTLTDQQINEFVSAMAKTPITYADKLYRFGIMKKVNSWIVVVILHHIIADAWSTTIIENMILRACHALVNGEEPVLPISSYVAFIEKEQEYLASKKYHRDRAFWAEVYAEQPEYVRIKPHVKASVTSCAHRFSSEIPAGLSAQIRSFCTKHAYSPAAVFEAAMLIYLDRINGRGKKPTVGLAVLNRDDAEDKSTLGMFISTVPLTAIPGPDKTLEDFCDEISDLHLLLYRHQKYPYSDILSDIHRRCGGTNKLFDVMMSYQNTQIDAGAGVRSTWYTNGNSEVALAFHIDDRDNRGVFSLNLDYQTEQFPEEYEVALLKDRILFIVDQIVTRGMMTINEAEILPAKEKELILRTFNDTSVDYPSDKCVHQLFEETAARIPDEIAVVFEGTSHTYSEINRMANCIAHTLRRSGIGRNDVVPIIAHRSYLILVAQLGILKAGAAYLPIDPTFPRDRIKYMLENASCKAVIYLGTDVPSNMETVLDLADESLYTDSSDNLININNPGDLCYVIYTSGSTGKPKGTLLTHRNAVNYSTKNKYNVVDRLISDEIRRIISITTIGFDIYLTESLLPLLNGMTIYYANDDESKMQRKLSKLISNNEIEIIQTTPTKIKMLMKDKNDLAWLSHLKVIILGGEVFPESLYDELRLYTDARIYNIYGPTETTVWSCVDEVTSSAVTIGSPVANTQILICDDQDELCPVGIAGELCIAGDGVAKGYLNRKDLTDEKFIDCAYTLGKLYKTGDFASYRADGKLLCYGRIDSQVKIRGLRVELGEIESVMNSFEGITLSAAAVKTLDEKQYLVGYYVSEYEINKKTLREYITAQLPQYMCPQYFVRLGQISFTPNGKIDRKSLPEIEFEIHDNVSVLPPETPMQKEVYEVVRDLIKGMDFGIAENFFDLGMDSLTAINLTSILSQKYACDLLVNDVYQFNTVEKMAEHLLQLTSHTPNHDLVHIKGGGKANLFLVHGGNGVVGNFVQLAAQLDTNYNWYGVDYPMSEALIYPHIINISRLAENYVERIRRVQPHGPYNLCGYCIGGQIVHEMAYLLEQAREKVDSIYMIASVPNKLTSRIRFDLVEDDRNIVSLLETTDHNRTLLTKERENVWSAIYQHIDEFDVDLSELRARLLDFLKPIDLTRAVPNYNTADVKTILNYVNLIRSLNYGSGVQAEHHTVSAPIDLFMGEQDGFVPEPEKNAVCWEEYTVGKVTKSMFAGDHFSWYEHGKNAGFLELFEACCRRHTDGA